MTCSNINKAIYFLIQHNLAYGLWCLMPLSTVFPLYRGTAQLVKPHTVPFEKLNFNK